jgi:hypothetical protein
MQKKPGHKGPGFESRVYRPRQRVAVDQATFLKALVTLSLSGPVVSVATF